MRKIRDTVHYLQTEIEQTRKSMGISPVYDGERVGSAKADRLRERHIKFCEQVMSILNKPCDDVRCSGEIREWNDFYESVVIPQNTAEIEFLRNERENLEKQLKEKSNNHSDIYGFELQLKEYCSNCGEFDADVEQVVCARFGCQSNAYTNVIRCQNEGKCARIAENLKRGG